MKLIHVASYRVEFFNGIKSVLKDLVPEQRRLGHEVYVFNPINNEKAVIPGEKYIPSTNAFIETVKSIHPDLVIFHSLYRPKAVMFSKQLLKMKIPYLIEPHGGTSLENSKKSRIKKKIANVIYAKKFIKEAAGLIYLNEKEADECIFRHVRKQLAIVPNGTHVHKLKEKSNSVGNVRFIFLGRIDIIQKGLDLLFPAIDDLCKKGYKDKVEFHFYGSVWSQQHTRLFDNFISHAANNVFFHGPAIGKDKEMAFENADIFILPSRYEGMPMAVLEALSYGLPCLLSRQTNVADIIENNHCGWVTETNINSICDTIITAVNDYQVNRDTLRKNAYEAVIPFEWSFVAALSISEYKRLAKLDK